jgi:hypothetical protein
MTNDLKQTILDIAAMRLDFPITQSDIDAMRAELEAVEKRHWYYCTFRKSFLLCLFGNDDVNDKTDMKWLSCADECPTIRRFCESAIFPMTNIKPRIIVIRTFPGMEMALHTDCYPHEMKKLEPKLRLVLKGSKSTLYFMNEVGEEVHIPKTWVSYIMSGATLHGMKNVDEEKFTLCFGDPWIGDDLQNPQFVAFMEDQINSHYHEAITISGLGDVDHLSGVKDPKVERIYSWDDWVENQSGVTDVQSA